MVTPSDQMSVRGRRLARAHLLGRHVAAASHRRRRLVMCSTVALARRRLRDAEVEDLDDACRRERCVEEQFAGLTSRCTMPRRAPRRAPSQA